MQQRREEFCGPYQRPRQIKGRPFCLYTKHNCPYGRHACELCGKAGHGAGDCQSHVPRVVPPPEPPIPPPAPEPSSSSVFVRGFGRKGEGKDANYGVDIPPPSPVQEEDLLLDPALTGSSSGLQGEEFPPTTRRPPPPIVATSELIELWMQENFTPLMNLSTNNPPEVGDDILWRGLKTGPNGNPSTKCEYFNAKVHSVGFGKDEELYLYVD